LAVLAFGVRGVRISDSYFLGVNQISLHGMTTLPTMLGLGALYAAWTKFHAPREVGVGPNGVRLDTGRESRTYGWDRIAWSTVQMGGMGFQRSLRLYDVKGEDSPI